ncbi:MAG: hypothetical protein FWC09_11405, partial [Lachnospiraceae bacterium]|nr:hypothetical protein [Lachnospiraceae bacterium]
PATIDQAGRINQVERRKNIDINLGGPENINRNSNEIILEMHKEGKSNMTIARSLGLGISEVKLVIDLFED